MAAVRASMVGCFALLMLPVALVAWFGLLFGEGPMLFTGKRVLASEGGAFRVLYQAGDEPRAREVAARVDGLSQRAGELVGDRVALHLDVELLGAPANHLGVFTGGKIRLATSADDATLAHELAHAHAWQLTGPHGAAHADATHFFDEGLADWVQARISGDEAVPLVAGAIAATGQARFEDLVDHARHLSRHDIRQSYVLGQVFVEALVREAGPEAPACALTELGRLGTDPMAGLAVWYAVAARCAFDLDAVQDRWLAALDDAQSRLPGPLPRLRIAVRDDGAGPYLALRDERALGWRLRCGFRSDPDDPPNRWLFSDARGGVCPVPMGQLVGQTVQYQVGFRLPGGRDDGLQDVFLEWTDLER
ncbi:MAG: hypothetical protein R3F59_29110 [Myxococcota bacterium]